MRRFLIVSGLLLTAQSVAAQAPHTIPYAQHKREIAAAERRGEKRGYATAQGRYERCIADKGRASGRGTAVGAAGAGLLAGSAGGGVGKSMLAAGAGGLAGNAIGRGGVKC